MKPLNELTLREYKIEQASGMFWERYPGATGDYREDCILKRKEEMKTESEQYGTRTLCSILSNMRDLHKTHNYSYLPGLIEEAQYRAERMENALESYGSEWDGLEKMEATRIKLKKEIKILEKKKAAFESDIVDQKG